MKTDILHTLQAVLLENTTSYQSDFEFDVTTLLEAAKEPKTEDRTYYWLSRPCGTWCLKERDVFLCKAPVLPDRFLLLLFKAEYLHYQEGFF